MSEMHKNRMPHGSYGQAGAGTRGYARAARPTGKLPPKTSMAYAQEFQDLAFAIAPERAGVLLGSAFPALTPSAGYQHDALDQIAREGFRTRRRQREVFPLLRGVFKTQ